MGAFRLVLLENRDVGLAAFESVRTASYGLFIAVATFLAVAQPSNQSSDAIRRQIRALLMARSIFLRTPRALQHLYRARESFSQQKGDES
jgi:hypothetical protein